MPIRDSDDARRSMTLKLWRCSGPTSAASILTDEKSSDLENGVCKEN